MDSIDSKEPIKLVVIGVGRIGRKHANLIGADSACSLVGICDIDSSRRLVAEEFNVPFYQQVEDLLESERPHGAIIATPNSDHASVTNICARYSVHVLIEKPIAESIESARYIIETGEQSGIHVLVGHHRRYNPLVRTTREIIQDGKLGKLVAVSMMWALLKPPEYYDEEWRKQRPGGGLALINLIHELDMLRFICGEVHRVYAETGASVRDLDVEDSLTISLLFENGVVASILASDTTPSPWSYEATTYENPYYFHTNENCYNFLGTRGSLSFPRMEMWSYTDANKVGWQHAMEQSVHSVILSDPLVYHLQLFCRVVKGQELPIIDARDAAQSLAVVLAVLDSIETESPVKIESCRA